MTLVQERAEMVAKMKDQEDRLENMEDEVRSKTQKQEVSIAIMRFNPKQVRDRSSLHPARIHLESCKH